MERCSVARSSAEDGQGRLSSLPILQLGPRRTVTATTRSNGSLPACPETRRGVDPLGHPLDVCGTDAGHAFVRVKCLAPNLAPDQAFLRGRWWFRTTDLRLGRAGTPNPLTCDDGRKRLLTSAFDCSTLLVVSQRFAFVRGTNAGQRETRSRTRPGSFAAVASLEPVTSGLRGACGCSPT
jgi:hypothetical protein